MTGGFPLEVFFHPQKGLKTISDLNHLIRPTDLARTCSGWRKINGFTFLLRRAVENITITYDLTKKQTEELQELRKFHTIRRELLH